MGDFLDLGAVQVGADVEVGVSGQDFGAGSKAERLSAPSAENALCIGVFDGCFGLHLIVGYWEFEDYTES
jgi:hypothetical protein